MKKISLPTDLLVALIQLEDKDVVHMLRTIISYANEGIVPTFSNAALKAFFSLFRSTIDEQRSSSERLSIINRQNASRKKSPAKKKDSHGSSSAKSLGEVSTSKDSVESEAVTDVTTIENESQPIVPTPSKSLTLETIESVYPRLGSYRSESLTLWSKFSDDVRMHAIDFIPSYVLQHPSVSDQLYLNQYLKAQPWNK